MNNEDKYIQNLFGEKLKHAEAPVDPAIWQGISNALPVAGAAGAGTSGAAFQMGTLGWVATGLVAVAIAVTTLVLQSPTPAEEVATVAPVVQTEPEVIAPAQEEVAVVAPEPTDNVVIEEPAQETKSPRAAQTEPKIQSSELQETNAAETPSAKTETEPQITQRNDTPDLVAEIEDQEPQATQPNPKLSAEFEVNEDTFEELNYVFIPAFIDAESFQWNFGDGTTSLEAQPSHSYESAGDFTVSLTTIDENGFEKQSERQLSVVLPPLLILPNTFTPDNNGKNDFLVAAVHMKNVTILTMSVFSTKGELIFEQDGTSTGWDGNLPDGTPAPKGDYVLIVKAIDASGENITKQRKVLLQRN